MKNIITGIGFPPFIVAAVRAVFIAGGAAAVGAALNQASIVDWGEYKWAAPFVILALRQAEGIFDQWTTPHQNEGAAGS
jgi:hypothetical protein